MTHKMLSMRMLSKAGMNAHITKPIDIKIILAVLDQVLGTSENPHR